MIPVTNLGKSPFAVLNADVSAPASGPAVLTPALAGGAPPTVDPAPLAAKERSWTWWLGGAISLALLAIALWQLRSVDFSRVRALIPTDPAFWIVFAAAYLASPFADWVIFRRLWHIPVAGFAALLRKLIGNEMLFGYVGELYLYTWARRRTEMTSAPFGTIKDVAILSAMTGNAVTLAMLALAYPLLGTLKLGIDAQTLFTSVGIVVGTSTIVLFFRNTLFSLPRGQLWYTAVIHLLRIFATTGLTALAWHLALPAVELQWWLLLSALRLLLARLPLLPNKDIAFAALAVFMIGHDAEIGQLMTMMATLVLTTHIMLGIALVAGDAIGWRRR